MRPSRIRLLTKAFGWKEAMGRRPMRQHRIITSLELVAAALDPAGHIYQKRCMKITKLLIANRGEIAIRIARAAADMSLPPVAVSSEDDANSLHLRVADEIRLLPAL